MATNMCSQAHAAAAFFVASSFNVGQSFSHNNSDHSILTALLSVENILGAKHTVWAVNTETAYHEIRGS